MRKRWVDGMAAGESSTRSSNARAGRKKSMRGGVPFSCARAAIVVLTNDGDGSDDDTPPRKNDGGTKLKAPSKRKKEFA